MGPPLIRRSVAGHLGRGVLLAIVVVMATTFVVGSVAFSHHVATALGTAGTSDPELGAVAGTIAIASDLGGATTPTAVGAELVDVAGSVRGVATASGTFDQPVSFRLSAEDQPDRPVQLRGLVFSSAFSDGWELVEGRAPIGFDEIAVDAGGLSAGETALGDRPELQVPIGTIDVRVVGVARRVSSAESAPSPGGLDVAASLADAHAIFDPDVIETVLAANGSFDRITVVPDGSRSTADLVAALRQTMPAGLVVTELTTSVGATQHTVSRIDDSVRQATLGFAMVSAAVATVVIANVWMVIVAQRTRELGLLRLIGASRRRVFASVVAESASLGLAGAAGGAVAGAWLGAVAARAVADSDAAIPFLLDTTMILAAVAVGLVVTVVGSLGAARRASTVPPLAALSEGWSTASDPPRWRRLVPTVSVVVGLVLVAAWRRYSPSGGAALGIAGALLATVGAAGWSRAAVGPVIKVAHRALSRSGPLTRMATGNALRHPSRTAAAASTLIVGMALVAVVGTGGASIRDTLSDQFRTASDADFFIERRGLVRVDSASLFGALNGGRLPVTAAAEVIAVDGIVRSDRATERRVVTADLSRIPTVVDVDVVEGSLSVDGPGLALSEAAANRLGLSLGAEAELVSVSGRSVDLPVIALYRDSSVYGHVIVDRGSVDTVGAEGTFELAAVSIDESASPRRARRFLDAVAREFPKVRVHDPEEFDALNTDVADTVLRVVSVLLIGSVAMGAIGMSATIALAVIERRRELALVRAVGADRRDIVAMVRTEAMLVAAVAGLVGIIVGVGIASIGLAVAPAEVAARTVVPWIPLAMAEVGAVGLGLVAAVGPARRASATSPLEALRDD